MSHASRKSVFKSSGVKLSTATGELLGRSTSCIFALPLTNGVAESNVTLYEAIDAHIWEGSSVDDTTEAFLEDVADVFMIAVSKMDANRPNRGIQIPAVWYPDRYLAESKELAREMRARKAAVERELDGMASCEARLVNYNASGKAAVNPSELLRTTIAHLEEEQKAQDLGDDTIGQADLSRQSRLEVLEKLKATHDRVAAKLKSRSAAMQPNSRGVDQTLQLLRRRSRGPEKVFKRYPRS